MMRYLQTEIDLMMNIKNDYVLALVDAKKTQNNIYIFFEFCNGGDLRRLLEAKGGSLSEWETQIITSQIAKGISYLGAEKIAHRDLKLDNILIHFPNQPADKVMTEKFLQQWTVEEVIEVTIGDLGFARRLDNGEDMTKSYCGTPLNMAPQILNNEEYDLKADIWSLGTLVYEMLVGFPPFTGTDVRNLAQNLNRGNYRIPKSLKVSLTCLNFIDSCLKSEPSKRIEHSQLPTHPFVTDPVADGTINLMASYFEPEPFRNVSDLGDQNSYEFNINESVLFSKFS